MAAALQDLLLAPETKPEVTADCYSLIDRQLAEMSGVSGTAVKLAYKAVTTFAPGYYQKKVEQMLPDLVARLQPFWADFTASGGSQFGDYLAKRGDEVPDALLTVTDAMLQRSGRLAIIKAYKTVRGGASRHIEAALPQVGELVQKYAG